MDDRRDPCPAPTAPRRAGSEAIERVLGRLERLVGCDMSACARLARLNGRWVHDGVVVRGGGPAREVWASAQGQPLLASWDPARPRSRALNRFRRTFASSGDAGCRSPVYSDARMLVYDEARFVCWIGLLRGAGERPFGAKELRRLNVAAPSIHAELVALDRRRLSDERGGRADLVFAPDGKLQAACDQGRAWIDAGRKEELASLVRRVDRGGPRQAVIAGRFVHVTRMEGSDQLVYLLKLCAPQRPIVTAAARLSKRQREVASLAAVGATVDEMAADLGVGRETVRQHLKRVYERLGVATRLELARTLDAP